MKITIHNMQDYTAEQVFRACLEPLLGLSKAAFNESRKNSSYVLGCPAGQLLSKAEARTFDKEGKNWGYLVNHGLVPDYCCHVIRAAQEIHDHPRVDRPVQEAKDYCEKQGWSTDWLEQFDEDMFLK